MNTNNMDTQYDVFISYSHYDYIDENKEVIPNNPVSEIMQLLKDNHLSYWIDEKGIFHGDEFLELLAENIENSMILLFLSSKNSNKSDWTSKEISAATQWKKKIIPVRLDDSSYNRKVMLQISDLDYVEYYKNPALAQQSLIRSIQKYKKEYEEKRAKEEQERQRQEKEKKELALAEKRRKEQEELANEISRAIQTISTSEEVLEKKRLEQKKQIDTIDSKSKQKDLLLALEKSNLSAFEERTQCRLLSEQIDSLNSEINSLKQEIEKAAEARRQELEAAKEAAIQRVREEFERKKQQAAEEAARKEKEHLEKEKEERKETDLTFIVKGVSFKMVKVAGGTFTMGATAEQGKDAYDNERPAHQVTLTDYYIGQTEVTQALWTAVMGSNPSYYKGDNLPVEYVSWYDCQTFIEKLNILLSNELGEMRFALPTEAQWEFAARGGNKSQGYKYAGSNNIDDVAWSCEAWWGNSGDMTTHPVAQKRPNELGLYDMSGNVEEWCQDWYGDYSSNAQTNPQGPTDGKKRVCRGGDWYIIDGYCRVSNRSSADPDHRSSPVFGGLNTRDSRLGFRLCLLPNINYYAKIRYY